MISSLWKDQDGEGSRMSNNIVQTAMFSARLLFIDFCFAFNTIIPQKLVEKQAQLCLNALMVQLDSGISDRDLHGVLCFQHQHTEPAGVHPNNSAARASSNNILVALQSEHHRLLPHPHHQYVPWVEQ